MNPNFPLTFEQPRWAQQGEGVRARFNILSTLLHSGVDIWEKKISESTLNVWHKCRMCHSDGTGTDAICWDKRSLHTPCHFWYLIPPIFSLFVSYWPIYGLLRVKIPNKKKSKVCEPLFTFSKMVHMSASLRNREKSAFTSAILR